MSGSTSAEAIKSYDVKDIMIKSAIAGTVCASASALLNGFDVTKIRMQNQSAHDIRYHGMISGARRIVAEEGFMGLTKGIPASMLREIVYSTVRMGGYEPLRKLMSSEADPSKSSPWVKYFSALIGGGVGAGLANPFDLIKTRFQSQLPGEPLPYRNTLVALSDIMKKYGFSGLYKGWMLTSSRAAVLTSAQLGTYDSVKNNIAINMLGLKDGFQLHLCSSMIAGVATTTASNPCKGIVVTFCLHLPYYSVDVIKTRYLSDDAGKYKSIMDCVIKTFRADGLRGFMKVG